MNKITTQQLHVLLKQFQVSFRLAFPKLTDQDYAAILAGERETLLALLQARYGYTPQQAKGAWNDFVLRIVDGTTPPISAPLCSLSLLGLMRKAGRQYATALPCLH